MSAGAGTKTDGAGKGFMSCRVHAAGFREADSNFYSLTIARDGRVYYTLSSHKIDHHGRVFRFDPQTEKVELVCCLGAACGETGKKMLPQGKSHSPFYEVDGWLYLATHYGFFATTDDREEPAPVPAGYGAYPGGHILRLNMQTGATEDLAQAPAEEGIITFNVDVKREKGYGLTWPKGYFLVFDLATRELKNLGPVSRGGESGRGDQYMCLVRTLAIDPRDGHVYFTNPDGQIYVYKPGAAAVERFGSLSMQREAFGTWDPQKPGHQGYNWRDILWHEGRQCFIGVHPKSGWLFAFEPREERIELLTRIVPEQLWKEGTYEPFRYGYLTLQLGPDQETLYYLSAVRDVAAEGLGGQRTLKEAMALVTYNLRTKVRIDHGVLRLEDGRLMRMAQCHAVHPNGWGYTCPWIEQPGKSAGEMHWDCDLVSYRDPLRGK